MIKGNKVDYVKRYRDLVDKVERGEINIGDACYEIAGGMAMSVLREDIKLAEIMREAEELKESSIKIKGNNDQRWIKLKSMIQNW
ncbi:MAG: hypothetical protein ACD_81C00004G0001 [uncultured bacterium]|uniref:Uncharacterized protein n=1 Tax=Candidatus Wolfebacteria bacterium GW2011_GWE2_44_13 TaxID=1619017 RepID=A0A0G1K546_9BACT|nr:MAG: hypothetical protein ACD_81C00004G0001 [uncultured bacterium]KKT42974.1 MAG: hypothetical protein UW32_C0003G0077 [Candidatus Wolfebacteria bacterium GW2011_GWE2_44_13]